MASNPMTSTPVQRLYNDIPCTQFTGCSPIVEQASTTPDQPSQTAIQREKPVTVMPFGIARHNKGLSEKCLSQLSLLEYESSPVKRVRSSVGTQRRIQLLSTCDNCTSKRGLVPTKQQTRRGTKKPMMGMTVISNNSAVSANVSSVASSVSARQPVMGLSVTRCSNSFTDSMRSGLSPELSQRATHTAQSSMERLRCDQPGDEGSTFTSIPHVIAAGCSTVFQFPPTSKRSRGTKKSVHISKVSSVDLFRIKKELCIREQKKSNVKSLAYKKLAQLRNLIKSTRRNEVHL